VPDLLRCSFCNKDQNDVRKLIAGPKVFICDECVEVCKDILAEDKRVEPRAPDVVASLRVVWCSLCRLPMAPKEALEVAGRGLVCQTCVSAVRAALDTDDASDERDEGH